MYRYGRQYSLFDAYIYNNTSAALVMTWSVVPADLLHAKLEVLSLQNARRFPPICHPTCLRSAYVTYSVYQMVVPIPVRSRRLAVLSGIKYVYERKKMAPLISLKSIFSPAPCHFPPPIISFLSSSFFSLLQPFLFFLSLSYPSTKHPKWSSPLSLVTPVSVSTVP